MSSPVLARWNTCSQLTLVLVLASQPKRRLQDSQPLLQRFTCVWVYLCALLIPRDLSQHFDTLHTWHWQIHAKRFQRKSTFRLSWLSLLAQLQNANLHLKCLSLRKVRIVCFWLRFVKKHNYFCTVDLWTDLQGGCVGLACLGQLVRYRRYCIDTISALWPVFLYVGL